ncbi:hypothetical protein J3459_021555 [Metarhizium acridum]|uniref:uncharacterized protein n=1 Tax=Metarhizium acridum TaxID=92637 RepID=UPI001C6B1B11|nr:hypothetical protein J3459_021555 [Metarhizium acridum]KAG8408810.1 hypothetical protein J3458_019825 [Metarhizium acridum]
MMSQKKAQPNIQPPAPLFNVIARSKREQKLICSCSANMFAAPWPDSSNYVILPICPSNTLQFNIITQLHHLGFPSCNTAKGPAFHQAIPLFSILHVTMSLHLKP